jgi:hypothetical protein
MHGTWSVKGIPYRGKQASTEAAGMDRDRHSDVTAKEQPGCIEYWWWGYF